MDEILARAGIFAGGDGPGRAPPPNPALQLHRTHLRRDPPPRKGDRPIARRGILPQPRVGGAGPRLPRLARHVDDTDREPGYWPIYATSCSTRRPRSADPTPTPRSPAAKLSEPSPNMTTEEPSRSPFCTDVGTQPTGTTGSSPRKLAWSCPLCPQDRGRGFLLRWPGRLSSKSPLLVQGVVCRSPGRQPACRPRRRGRRSARKSGRATPHRQRRGPRASTRDP